MKPRDLDQKQLERAEITTESQAINWVNELIQDMLQWRNKCNVKFPKDTDRTVRYQQRAMWTFLNKQGQAIGALKAFRLTGIIGDVAYKEIHQRAINALAPSVVGIVVPS